MILLFLTGPSIYFWRGEYSSFSYTGLRWKLFQGLLKNQKPIITIQNGQNVKTLKENTSICCYFIFLPDKLSLKNIYTIKIWNSHILSFLFSRMWPKIWTVVENARTISNLTKHPWVIYHLQVFYYKHITNIIIYHKIYAIASKE